MDDQLRRLWDLRRRKNTWRVIYLVISLVLLYLYAHHYPWRFGDGGEYDAIAEAWTNHFTPDLRPGDVVSWKRSLGSSIPNCPSPYIGFLQTRQHTYVSAHFWLYPLLTVPAKLVLRHCGISELASFQVTNLLLFLLALYLALFYSRYPLSHRITFAGLAALSPVVWYMDWPHPEVFTWSLVVMSLVMAGNKSLVWAALFAGLAATQNPPVAILALFYVGLALFQGGVKLAAMTGVASLVALTPNLYFHLTLGHFSPLLAGGAAALRFISWPRTFSFFLDLNQGMLPYVPFLLLLFVVAVVRLAIRRKFADLALLLAIVPMVAVAETTANWNSACAGMMRYAVWMVPLLAWVAVAGLADLRAGRVALAVALVGQLVLTFHFGLWADTSQFQTPLAAYVLERHPLWYNPDPEIFTERQRHNEQAFTYDLPVVHADPTWNVTKLLTDAASLDRMAEKYRVDPNYLRTVKAQYGLKKGLFYLNPPPGAVRLRKGIQPFWRS